MSRSPSLPVAKLVPFFRAITDPEGTGTLTREQADTVRQIEANLSSCGRPDSPDPTIVYESGDSGWIIASIPAVGRVFSQGRTYDEAR